MKKSCHDLIGFIVLFNEILFKNNFSYKVANYHNFEKNNQII